MNCITCQMNCFHLKMNWFPFQISKKSIKFLIQSFGNQLRPLQILLKSMRRRPFACTQMSQAATIHRSPTLAHSMMVFPVHLAVLFHAFSKTCYSSLLPCNSLQWVRVPWGLWEPSTTPPAQMRPSGRTRWVWHARGLKIRCAWGLVRGFSITVIHVYT